MAHARAKLTPLGRRLLVDRVLVFGWTPAEAAKAAGVSRATCYKWLRRFRDEGPAGMEERPSRPNRCPHALAARAEREILRARRRSKRGRTGWPRSSGIPAPPSTAYSADNGVSCERSRPGSASTIPADPTPRWEATRRCRGCRQRRWELHLGLLASFGRVIVSSSLARW